MNHSAAWLDAAVRSGALRPRRSATPTRRLRGDRGEGVISAAIAVLIVAFLGALMWAAFSLMWGNIQNNTCDQIGEIGGNAATNADCHTGNN